MAKRSYPKKQKILTRQHNLTFYDLYNYIRKRNMKIKVKEKPKRLLIDVSQEMHYVIKSRAAKKQLTMREWVLIAVTERINREMIEEI